MNPLVLLLLVSLTTPSWYTIGQHSWADYSALLPAALARGLFTSLTLRLASLKKSGAAKARSKKARLSRAMAKLVFKDAFSAAVFTLDYIRGSTAFIRSRSLS